MPAEPRDDLTAAANEASPQQDRRLSALIDEHYDQLRALAARILFHDRLGGQLSPTTLVHEAYMRLVDSSRVTQQGAAFFRSCFARTCRRILVDRARARRALRNGGGHRRQVALDSVAVDGVGDFDLLDLHEAIEELALFDERMARVVELRLFGTLTIPECAQVLGVCPRTVDSDWSYALTWFRRQLR